MPTIRNGYQSNGLAGATKFANGNSSGKQPAQREEAKSLADAKLQIIREHQATNPMANGFSKQPKVLTNEDAFQDTFAQPNVHSQTKEQESEQMIPIYDGQSNTSIAQTAKDQFAAALLRLQSGLDDSSRRLEVVEARLDDLIKQQRLQQQTRLKKTQSVNVAATFVKQSTTIVYLGWPVLVFVALRALEKRSLSASTMSVVTSN